MEGTAAFVLLSLCVLPIERAEETEYLKTVAALRSSGLGSTAPQGGVDAAIIFRASST